ncbi:MAG TPA: hypothetical protein VFF73_41525 [Planctomycetota bacterium]|nr:hypothetical protein [Planctomycetota bacterium]
MTDCEKFVDALANRDVAAQRELAGHVASCASCRETAESMASLNAEFSKERKISVDVGELRARVIAGAKKAVAEERAPRGEVVKLKTPSRQWKTFLMAASIAFVMFAVGRFTAPGPGGTSSGGLEGLRHAEITLSGGGDEFFREEAKVLQERLRGHHRGEVAAAGGTALRAEVRGR